MFIKSAVDGASYLICTAAGNNTYSLQMSGGSTDFAPEWMLVQDMGNLQANDISFGAMPPGNVLVGSGSSVLVDNTAGTVPLMANVILEYGETDTIGETYSTADSTTKTITASLGLGGTIAKALSIDLKGEISESTTHSTTFESSSTKATTKTFTQEITVSVPAGESAIYTLTAAIGMIPQTTATVTATMYSSLPGASPFPVSLPGSYSGSQLMQFEIVRSSPSSSEGKSVAVLPPPKKPPVLLR